MKNKDWFPFRMPYEKTYSTPYFAYKYAMQSKESRNFRLNIFYQTVSLNHLRHVMTDRKIQTC